MSEGSVSEGSSALEGYLCYRGLSDAIVEGDLGPPGRREDILPMRTVGGSIKGNAIRGRFYRPG